MTSDGATVLVVDDEPEILDLMRDFLEGEGFRALTVSDARAALAELAAGPVDCLLVDVMMPGMSGYGLCRHVRQTSDVPIIFLTAREADEDKIRGLGLGADDYVVKSARPGEVVARIKAVLRRTRRSAPPPARAGGGSIVNVSSVEGLRGAPDLAAYAASKWAVRGMTKVAAVELGPRGIRVNSIHPGAIDTPMLRSAGLEEVDLDGFFGRIPLRRAGRPEDVVGLALYLASEESSYCTGAEFTVDGGATAFIGWGGPRPRPRRS
jgi:NAD(P)-dependent dehydrogenase (short-subunit alcohol dehydrogenase family)